MKDIVKYIMIVSLTILAIYHKAEEPTPLLDCLYFAVEYLALASVFMYLAMLMTSFKDMVFFAVLSGYFALKLIYNTFLYIDTISVKMGMHGSETWGFAFTVIIILGLILIQFGYVKER